MCILNSSSYGSHTWYSRPAQNSEDDSTAINNIHLEAVTISEIGSPARKLSWTAWAYGHPNKGILDMLQSTVTATRLPIHIQAGTGAKQFVSYKVSKAIYATGWDGNIDLEADALGHWKKIENSVVPALVNINTALLSELMTLSVIGPVKAQAIIDFRTSHDNFATADDLDNVPGIGPATITLLKPYITS